jgi:membrane-associated protease RseP (regulator of RpoE activity)
MKKLHIIGILVAFLFVVMPAMAPPPSNDFPLFAGQTEQIGIVRVTNDATNLRVMYTIDEEGWYMNESHVSVNSSAADIPQTKNHNPIPGKFAYSMKHLPPAITYTYTIPLANLPPGTVFYIAAQADVVHAGVQDDAVIATPIVYDRAAGAWAAERFGVQPFTGKNWATYFHYVLIAG